MTSHLMKNKGQGASAEQAEAPFLAKRTGRSGAKMRIRVLENAVK